MSHPLLLKLTPRERQVAAHVCAGRGNREIARLMGISYQVAKNYCQRLYKLSGSHSKAEFIVFCRDRHISFLPRE